MKQVRFLILLMISIFVIGWISSCKKSKIVEIPKIDEPPGIITVSTKETRKITSNSAEAAVIIQVNGSATIDLVGICLDTSTNPTLSSIVHTVRDGDETYRNTIDTIKVDLYKLDYNTTYYVRAYVRYNDSIYYGKVEQFQTKGKEDSLSQYWTLGNFINSNTIYTTNRDQWVQFIDNDRNSGSISFYNELQAPIDYTVVNRSNPLLPSQVSIGMEYEKDNERWQSVSGGNGKVITSIEKDKVKIEFQNVKMTSNKDGRIAISSATFYVVY